jgi:hypothetical protein
LKLKEKLRETSQSLTDGWIQSRCLLKEGRSLTRLECSLFSPKETEDCKGITQVCFSSLVAFPFPYTTTMMLQTKLEIGNFEISFKPNANAKKATMNLLDFVEGNSAPLDLQKVSGVIILKMIAEEDEPASKAAATPKMMLAPIKKAI